MLYTKPTYRKDFFYLRISQFFVAASVMAIGFAGSAHAVLITQWNFNSTTPDNNTSTGRLAPNLGTGTVTPQGGVTASFASGAADGGSSDPATDDDSGYQTVGYPTISASNKTAGVAFFTSTVGFEDIIVEYDLRHSNGSSRYEQAQYTTNGGTNWTDFAVFDGNAGTTWFNNRTVDLSAIAAVENNAQFGFRVVTTFAPSTTSYAPSDSASTYSGGGSGGTWRFDTVEFNATAVIPEANTFGFFAFALPVIGAVIARRRKSS